MTDMPAIVAFNAGNLLPVAQTYRALYPDRAIYIAGDDDRPRACNRTVFFPPQAAAGLSGNHYRLCRPTPDLDRRGDPLPPVLSMIRNGKVAFGRR
jgi:hypothetical protein